VSDNGVVGRAMNVVVRLQHSSARHYESKARGRIDAVEHERNASESVGETHRGLSVDMQIDKQQQRAILQRISVRGQRLVERNDRE
jgi:hypothetical protein